MGVDSESKSVCSSTVSPYFLLCIFENVREMCAKAGKGAIDTSAQNWCLAGMITIWTLASIDKRQIWTLASIDKRQIWTLESIDKRQIWTLESIDKRQN